MNRQIYLKTFLYFVCVSQGYKRIQEKTCSYLFFSFKQAFKAKKKLKEKTMNCYLVWKHSALGHFCIKRREKDSRKVILDFASSETRKKPLSFRSILAPKAFFSVRNLRSIMKKKKARFSCLRTCNSGIQNTLGHFKQYIGRQNTKKGTKFWWSVN